MKADGIRLDYGYGGNEESLMTFNPHDLSIEVNMSNNTHYIETIMDFYRISIILEVAIIFIHTVIRV